MRLDSADDLPRRPVRRADLRTGAYATLREMLTENRFAENSPLKIRVLAELLQVSPTPIREALVQLEASGLVVHEPNLGFRVAPQPPPEELADLMDARAVLEVAAARRAAIRGGSAAAAALAAELAAQRTAAGLLESSDEAERTQALRDYLRHDHAFHFAVFHGCGSPALLRLAATTDGQAVRVRQVFHHGISRGISDAADTIAEHAGVAAAITAGDADAAERAMQAHLDRVLDDWVRRARPDAGTG